MSYDTLPRLLILECAYRDLSDRIFSECSFHDSLLRPEISNKRITKQIPTSPVFRTAYFIIQS